MLPIFFSAQESLHGSFRFSSELQCKGKNNIDNKEKSYQYGYTVIKSYVFSYRSYGISYPQLRCGYHATLSNNG